LVAQARSERAWAGVRASAGVSGGKHYFEVAMRDDGLVRVGWSSAAASRELGTDSHGFGYGGAGMKSHAKAFTPYGRPFGAGDVVGAALDADVGEVAFSLNGAPLGAAFALPAHLRGSALFPALCLKNAEAALNFGGAPFAHAPPAGFSALAAAPPGTLVTPASQAPMGGAGGAGFARRTPRAIVLEPARDLAEQTASAFASLGAHLVCPALSCALCVGGVDPAPALRALRDGCDIVTGTPARVLDLVQSGQLELCAARFLILDEADRLLETGSADAILALFRAFPRAAAAAGGARRLQVLLFSATLHAPSVVGMADVLCDRPTWVDLKGRDFVPDSVHHAVLCCDPAGERWEALAPVAPVDNAHAHDPHAGAGAAPLTREAASAAVKRLKPHMLLRLVRSSRAA
jgi:ATP-dependent RNA helicase DDX1